MPFQGPWASLSGLTLAAHKAFLTLILDDFEYDLAATALRTMRSGSSGIVPLEGAVAVISFLSLKHFQWIPISA